MPQHDRQRPARRIARISREALDRLYERAREAYETDDPDYEGILSTYERGLAAFEEDERAGARPWREVRAEDERGEQVEATIETAPRPRRTEPPLPAGGRYNRFGEVVVDPQSGPSRATIEAGGRRRAGVDVRRRGESAFDLALPARRTQPTDLPRAIEEALPLGEPDPLRRAVMAPAPYERPTVQDVARETPEEREPITYRYGPREVARLSAQAREMSRVVPGAPDQPTPERAAELRAVAQNLEDLWRNQEALGRGWGYIGPRALQLASLGSLDPAAEVRGALGEMRERGRIPTPQRLEELGLGERVASPLEGLPAEERRALPELEPGRGGEELAAYGLGMVPWMVAGLPAEMRGYTALARALAARGASPRLVRAIAQAGGAPLQGATTGARIGERAVRGALQGAGVGAAYDVGTALTEGLDPAAQAGFGLLAGGVFGPVAENLMAAGARGLRRLSPRQRAIGRTAAGAGAGLLLADEEGGRNEAVVGALAGAALPRLLPRGSRIHPLRATAEEMRPTGQSVSPEVDALLRMGERSRYGQPDPFLSWYEGLQRRARGRAAFEGARSTGAGGPEAGRAAERAREPSFEEEDIYRPERRRALTNQVIAAAVAAGAMTQEEGDDRLALAAAIAGGAPAGRRIVAELRPDLPRELSEALVREFGETDIPEHAGYLLSDGRLIDLEGSGGMRGADHRAVGRLFDVRLEGRIVDPSAVSGGRWAPVQRVMDEGHARLHVSDDLVSVDISQPLTGRQRARLREVLAERRGARLVLDLTRDGETIKAIEIPNARTLDVDEAAAEAERVFGDFDAGPPTDINQVRFPARAAVLLDDGRILTGNSHPEIAMRYPALVARAQAEGFVDARGVVAEGAPVPREAWMSREEAEAAQDALRGVQGVGGRRATTETLTRGGGYSMRDEERFVEMNALRRQKGLPEFTRAEFMERILQRREELEARRQRVAAEARRLGRPILAALLAAGLTDDEDDGAILAASGVALGSGRFYWRSVRAIENAKINKATVSEWRNYLTKQPMLREEFQRIIEPTLERIERMSPGRAVTKAELVEATRLEAPRLEERYRDDDRPRSVVVRYPDGSAVDSFGSLAEAEAALEEMERWAVSAIARENYGVNEEFVILDTRTNDILDGGYTDRKEAERAVAGWVDDARDETAVEVVSQWTVRDLADNVLARFESEREAEEFVRERASDDYFNDSERLFIDDEGEGDPHDYGVYTLAGETTGERPRGYREIVIQAPGIRYSAPHYAGIPDQLVEMRLHEGVVDPENPGSRGLFVEEIQSDLHQSARGLGYEDEWLVVEIGKDGKRRVRGRFATQAEADAKALAHREQAPEGGIVEVTKGQLPRAPLARSEDWVGLAWRRVVDEAIESDADFIAWTTGAQQAHRWNHWKFVDRITYDPRTEILRAYRDGRQLLESVVPPAELDRYLPKGEAEVLLARPLTAQALAWNDAIGVHQGLYTDAWLDNGMQVEVRLRNDDTAAVVVWDGKQRMLTAEIKAANLEEAKRGAEELVRGYGFADTAAHELTKSMAVGERSVSVFYDDVLPKVIREWARRRGVRVEIEQAPLVVEGRTLQDNVDVPAGGTREGGDDGPVLMQPRIYLTPELKARLVAEGQEIGATAPEVPAAIARTGAAALTGSYFGAQAGGRDQEDRQRRALIGAVAGAILANARHLGVPLSPGTRKTLAPYIGSATGMGLLSGALDGSEDANLDFTGSYAPALAGAILARGVWRAAGERGTLRALYEALSDRARAGQPWAKSVLNTLGLGGLLQTRDARTALRAAREGMPKAAGRTEVLAHSAELLGPDADRALSDLIENEQWQRTPLGHRTMQALVQLAEEIKAQYHELRQALVARGILPDSVLEEYALGDYLRRIYAEHLPIQGAEPATRAQGMGPARIGARYARIKDLPRSAREKAGEVREASWRIRQGMWQDRKDILLHDLFDALVADIDPQYRALVQQERAASRAVHTAWLARKGKRGAARKKANADLRAASQAREQIRQQLQAWRAQKKGTSGREWVALPDTPGLGPLRGALVRREVAKEIEELGDVSPSLLQKAVSWWARLHTVYNLPGTHIGNTVSNITMMAMAGIPLWRQPLLWRDMIRDLAEWGPYARRITALGMMGQAESAVGASAMRPARITRKMGERLAETTMPHTKAALAARDIGPESERAWLVRAARAVDERLGGLYNAEDVVARMALLRHAIEELGMGEREAEDYVVRYLGDFRQPPGRTLRAMRPLVPFAGYTVEMGPRFIAAILDHPERWLALVAPLAYLDQRAQEQVGRPEESDRAQPRVRNPFGYLMPRSVQLPFRDREGNYAYFNPQRFTPGSAIFSAAPPGTVGSQVFGEDRLLGGLEPTGPAFSLMGRLAGREPMTGEPQYPGTYRPGVRGGLQRLARQLIGPAATGEFPSDLGLVGETLLPTVASFHAPRVARDLYNRDYPAAATDVLGAFAARPTFVRSGAYEARVLFEVEQQRRQVNRRFDLEVDRARNNPERVAELERRREQELDYLDEIEERRLRERR